MDRNEKQLDRIEMKLDRLDQRQDVMDITLAKQETNLKEHMRRSLANEEAVAILKDELKPVINHVFLMNAIFKFTAFALGSGFIWTFFSYLTK